MRLDVGQDPRDPRAQSDVERTAVVLNGVELRNHFLGALLQQGSQHVVLVLEVVVDGSHGDARSFGDVLDARAVKPSLRKYRLGRIEDRVAEERACLVAPPQRRLDVHGRLPSGAAPGQAARGLARIFIA